MRPHIRLSMAVKLPYMSERTFSKYLRSATGLTFSAMVKKLRIALRKRLFDDHGLHRPGSGAERLPHHGELQPPVPGRGGGDPDGPPQPRVVAEATCRGVQPRAPGARRRRTHA